MHYRLVITLFTLGVCLLSYTNCDRALPFAKSKNTSLAPKIGGDHGYEGKITFTSPSAGTCSDGSSVDSQVEMTADRKQAFLTRKSCQTVPSQEVSIASLDLLPHNPDNLVTSERFFELREEVPTGKTVVFCRGKATESSDYNFAVTDVVDTIVKSTGVGTYSAHMIYARYDLQGNIISTRTYPERPEELWTVPWTPGEIYFDYRDETSRLWHLNVKPVSGGSGETLTTGGVVFYDSGNLGVWEFPCFRLM